MNDFSHAVYDGANEIPFALRLDSDKAGTLAIRGMEQKLSSLKSTAGKMVVTGRSQCPHSYAPSRWR